MSTLMLCFWQKHIPPCPQTFIFAESKRIKGNKMKGYILIIYLGLLASCSSGDRDTSSSSTDYQSFGQEITAEEAAEVAGLAGMAEDSVYTKVSGRVVEVCQARGCWMKLDLGNNETMRVTFKDYSFFVPKDSRGKKVIIEGVAVRKVTPVDELRHYAEDAGKTPEEVALITEARQELAFEAVGVLMK